ncbi:MAG: hypothetical protein Kow0091_21980 [Geminocystis sp.]
MFPFPSRKPNKKVIIPQKKNFPSSSPRRVNIPSHFQKNPLITYSQIEIERELQKYPGLLRTLSHAYQYQVTFMDDKTENQYWFCRNIELTMILLKYLNEKNWSVDWQEKPFILK